MPAEWSLQQRRPEGSVGSRARACPFRRSILSITTIDFVDASSLSILQSCEARDGASTHPLAGRSTPECSHSVGWAMPPPRQSRHVREPPRQRWEDRNRDEATILLTGAEYKRSLQDGRKVWIFGEGDVPD